MIHVVKQQRGEIFSIKLSGSIEENVDFMALIGVPSGKVVEVLLKEVTRINSLGVKSWIKFFQALQAKGLQLKFLECSTAIVEQMNSVMNFNCGGTVESLYVPYVCQNCKMELLGLFRATDLKKILFKVPDLPCPQCKSQAGFDDSPQEYFAFLQRR